MAAPYAIIGLAGDSNGFWGKFRDAGTDLLGHSRLFQFNQLNQVVLATEPLDNLGYGLGDGHKVGSTIALCRDYLIPNGHLPAGFDILIVPHCWAGTAFANFWATTGSRSAIGPFITRMNAAVALHPSNFVWFFDWNHGANDGGSLANVYKNNMIATWAEIRASVTTASTAPILVTGLPPDRYDPALGGALNLPFVVADQQAVESYLANSAYIDPTGLKSDTTNGYVHFSAASHRGGIDNSARAWPTPETNPISERKYEGLISLGLFANEEIEVHMEAPDAIGVVIYDGEITAGNIADVYQDESATAYHTGGFWAAANNWVLRNNERDNNAAQRAVIIGVNKAQMRFQDILSTHNVNRVAARTPANWSISGGYTVTAVSHSCEPVMQGETNFGGQNLSVSQRHKFVLKLNNVLAEGTYIISNSTAGVLGTEFVFNDRVTRADGIIVNQVGYRNDNWKLGILSARIPYNTGGGAVDFATTYGVTQFEVLDSNKNTVYTGTVDLRSSPSTTEPGWTNINVADLSTERTVGAITKGNITTIDTVGSHGYVTGDKVFFRGIGGITGLEGLWGSNGTTPWTITVLDTNTFTVPYNSSAVVATFTPGAWSEADGGHDAKVYKTNLVNRHGTYVYWLDFSGFTTGANGTYYLHVPGYGISYPFKIDNAAYAVTAAAVHKGLFAMRRGIDVSATIDFPRGANLNDTGSNDVRVYWSNCIGAMSNEYSQFSTATPFMAGAMAYTPAIDLTARVSLPASGWMHQDAGDLDSYPLDHLPAFYVLMMALQELPQASRVTGFVVPKMSTINSSRYDASTDAWPPLMHEIAWYLDFGLSTQSNGKCPSAFGVGHFSAQTSNYPEPSDIYRGTDGKWRTDNAIVDRVHGFVGRADHWSNYWWAAAFAKFAQLCYDYSSDDVGDEYRDAAIAAWDWAESIRTSHINDGVDRDAYYDTELDLMNIPVANRPAHISSTNTTGDLVSAANSTGAHQLTTGMKVRLTKFGTDALPAPLSDATEYWVNCPSTSTCSFHLTSADALANTNKVDLTLAGNGVVYRVLTAAEYTTAMAMLHSGLSSPRLNAAATLYRLLGSVSGAAYGAIITTGAANYYGSWFEYIKTSGANAATVAYFNAHFNDNYGDELAYNGTAGLGYPYGGSTNASTIHNTTPSSYQGMVGTLLKAIADGDIVRRDQALNWFRGHIGWVAGCNAVNKSFIAGTGSRWARTQLFDDAYTHGSESPVGYVNFAYRLWPLIGINPQGFSGHNVSGLSYISDNVSPSVSSMAYKVYEPYRLAQPYWYAQMEVRGMVYHGEGQLHFTMMPALVSALLAHGWDGNDDYAYDTRANVRFRYRRNRA